MKYCLNYNNKSKYIEEVDEVRINYNKQKLDAIEYMLNHKNQTIILYIDTFEKIELNKLCRLSKENKDIKFKIEFNQNILDNIDEIKETVKDYNIKFYFDYHCSDWASVKNLALIGVSDIYVTAELGFELQELSKVLHKNGITIRCFPNIAQTTWEHKKCTIKDFFIRPEDVDNYENIVDVMEFYAPHEKTDIYYEIYSKDKKWFGDLKEIILNLDESIDSRFIINEFAIKRLNCRKICQQNGNCNRCDEILKLSKNLEKAGIMVNLEEVK